ncbi:MAG TPA: glycoside hydrolase family 75 protein [Pyrinomonadaceae bacterium]|nr:glycoside hydrolase family 75 protein [Pyrinomonadaceae bacterium]
MKYVFALAVSLGMVQLVTAQAQYTPPPRSAEAVQGVPWTKAVAAGNKFRNRFRECETRNTCDGKRLKYGCRRDPSRNTAILRFRDGTIFFDGKMGLDADGSPYSRNTPGQTDQPETSYRYAVPGKPSVDADKVPFIVIPQGGFDANLGVEVGDVAAVIYEGKVSYALVADLGPKCKIGEGSIQLHEELGHKVCRARNAAGECTNLNNLGIGSGVLYFIFPSSKITGLTPANAVQRIREEGERLLTAFRRDTR